MVALFKNYFGPLNWKVIILVGNFTQKYTKMVNLED